MQTRSGGKSARASEASPAATAKMTSSQTHDYSRADDDEVIDDGSLIRKPIREFSGKDSKTTKATLNASISKMKLGGNTDLDESLAERTHKAKGPGSKKGKQNVTRLGDSSPVPQNRREKENYDHGESGSDDEAEDHEEQEPLPASDFNRSSSTVTEKIQSSKTVHSRRTEEDTWGQPRLRPRKVPEKPLWGDMNTSSFSGGNNFEKQSWGDMNTSTFSSGTSKLQKQEWEDMKKSNFSRGTSNYQKQQRVVLNKSTFSDDDEPELRPRKAKVEDHSESHQDRGTLTVFIVLLLLGALLFWFWPLVLEKLSTRKAADKLQVVKDFQNRFRKLPILFPGQSQDLWHRSRRILEVNLNHGKENKEPAIILLTAAQDARHTLQCIGNQLAKTYASSFNSSYIVISGSGKSSEDSERVKMDIDNKLSGGFQATKKAAVLHQIELLPPGSLLILYKYCDHENAAYKNVALVLTVLLKNSTLASDTPLGELEEAVYDFLKETFISSKLRASHSEMDGDKLGGVWSRISHVVLPVVPEKDNVKECDEPDTRP